LIYYSSGLPASATGYKEGKKHGMKVFYN